MDEIFYCHPDSQWNESLQMIGKKDPRLIPQQQILDMLLLSFQILIDMNRCKGKFNVPGHYQSISSLD